MATITNLTSGIEVNFAGAVTYIKHGNVKLLKRGTNINIYDDSDDDGNQRGQVYISIPFSEVTNPSTADIDALYTAVRGFIDVSSGGGGGADANAVHVNAANEINGITAKGTPTTSDILLIEDAADSNKKKKITIGDIPSSGSASPLTTKGDLYSFDTNNARLPVGTNGQILVADSNESTGLKWQGNNTIGTKVVIEGKMDTNQSISANTNTRIDFVDTVDVNSEWDDSTHKFTVGASGDGTYQFTNSLFFQNNNGYSYLCIYKNGTKIDINYGTAYYTVAGNTWESPNGTINLELAVGDYIEFYVRSTTGFSFASQWYDNNIFQITKIGNNLTVNNVVLQTLNKTFTLQEPTATDDITVFRTDVDITVQEVIACSTGGGTISTTYQLKHHPTRSDAGNALTTSAATTSTTIGDTASLSDATIPADSWIWLETTDASGTAVYLSIDIRYTED